MADKWTDERIDDVVEALKLSEGDTLREFAAEIIDQLRAEVRRLEERWDDAASEARFHDV